MFISTENRIVLAWLIAGNAHISLCLLDGSFVSHRVILLSTFPLPKDQGKLVRTQGCRDNRNTSSTSYKLVTMAGCFHIYRECLKETQKTMSDLIRTSKILPNAKNNVRSFKNLQDHLVPFPHFTGGEIQPRTEVSRQMARREVGGHSNCMGDCQCKVA